MSMLFEHLKRLRTLQSQENLLQLGSKTINGFTFYFIGTRATEVPAPSARVINNVSKILLIPELR